MNRDDEKKCRYCRQFALLEDWRTGDRVCTNCGVVDEEHLRDDAPEWKNFNEADDLAKGLPSGARCGLAANELTTLSRNGFGGATFGQGFTNNTDARVSLAKTQRKIENIFEKERKEKEELAKAIMAKRRSSRGNSGVINNIKKEDQEDEDREEEEQIAEVDLWRSQTLTMEKWSVERAVILYGTHEEAEIILSAKFQNSYQQCDLEKERENLLPQLEPTHKAAAKDVYLANSILNQAGNNLKLPDKIIKECTIYMCKFISRKDGFHIKGVKKRPTQIQTQPPTGRVPNKLLTQLGRDNNAFRQMRALTSALLYICAKKSGWGRSLNDICNTHNTNNIEGVESLRPKAIFKGVMELKSSFPDLFCTLTTPATEAANLVQHSTHLLQLPHVTVEAIRLITLYCGKEQQELGTAAGIAPQTICAAVTYLVCNAGGTMQRLAKQALRERVADNHNDRKGTLTGIDLIMERQSKKRKICHEDLVHGELKPEIVKSEPEPELVTSISSPDLITSQTSQFDVHSTSALSYPNHKILQTWLPWSDQPIWDRDLITIAEHANASKRAVLEFYKRYLHPRRSHLLSEIKGFLEEAHVGLGNIVDSAPLMIFGQA